MRMTSTRERLISIAAGSVAAIVLFTGWRAIPRAIGIRPASIRMPVPSALDLGDGKPGEVVTGEFTLGNSGGVDLDYKIEASCGCSKLSPQAGKIPPGASQKIQVGMQLNAEGQKRSVRLIVRSSDPARPTETIEIVADCPAPAIATPTRVNFGRLDPTNAKEQMVTIEVKEGSLRGDLATVICKSSSDTFRTSIARLEESPPKVVLKVECPASLPLGVSADSVRVMWPDGVKLVDIPVTAEVSHPLIVVPEIAFLRATKSPGDPIRTQVLVKRTDGKPVSPLVKSEASDEVSIVEIGNLNGGFRRFQLDFEALPDEPVRVQFHFEGESEAVGVKVVPVAVDRRN